MDVNIDSEGVVSAQGQVVGKLDGLKFIADDNSSAPEGALDAKAVEAAALQAAGPEIDRRMTAMISAQHDVFSLGEDGAVRWGEAKVGLISPGKSILHPVVDVIGAEHGTVKLRDMLAARLNDFIQSEITTKLTPLKLLESLMTSKDVMPAARGFAFEMFEVNGLMQRRGNEAKIKALESDARGDVRSTGLRFGEYFVYMPELIRPAPARLFSILTAFAQAADNGGDKKPFIPFAGVTSIAMEDGYSEAAFNAAGYSGRGTRIIRVDILNRLAGVIRQAKTEARGTKFHISLEMLALLGSSFDECKDVLRALGYKSEQSNFKPPKNQNQPKPSTAHTVEGKGKAADDYDAAQLSETDTPIGRGAAMDAALETDTAPQASPHSLGKDGKPKHNMPAPPKPKVTKKTGPLPLVYYMPAIGEDADGHPIREDQTEIWFMPYTPFNKPARAPQSPKGTDQTGRADNTRQKRPRANFKGKKPHKPREDNSYKPAKPVRKLEDSPFAALAALQAPKKD